MRFPGRQIARGFIPTDWGQRLNTWIVPKYGQANWARALGTSVNSTVSGNCSGLTLGSEANLIVGGWFTSGASTTTMWGQWRTDNNGRSWRIRRDGSNQLIFEVSGAGTATDASAVAADTITNSTWYFFLAGHSGANNKIWIRMASQSASGTTVSGAYSSGLNSANSPPYILGGYQNGASTYTEEFTSSNVDELLIGQPASLDDSTFDALFLSLWNNGTGVLYQQVDAATKTSLGLISWYPCADSAGNNFFDAHGANNLDVLLKGSAATNAVGVPSGQVKDYNFSTAFNGSNQYVTNTYSPSGTTYTISVWYRPNLVSSARVFSSVRSTSSANPMWWNLAQSAGNALTFQVKDDAGVSATCTKAGVINLNAWILVVAVRSGNNLTLYVDNDTANPATATASIGTITASEFNLGAEVAGSSTRVNLASCRMDAHGIWSRALSTSELTQLYNNSRGLKYLSLPEGLKSGLVAWHDLDEPTGTVKADSAGSLTLTDGGGSNSTRTLGLNYSEGVVAKVASRSLSGTTIYASASSSKPAFESLTLPCGMYLFDGTDDMMQVPFNPTNDGSNPGGVYSYGAFYFIVQPAALAVLKCFTSFCDIGAANDFLAIRLDTSLGTRVEVASSIAGSLTSVYGSTVLTVGSTYVVGVIATGNSWRIRVNGQEETLTVASGSNSGKWLEGSSNRDIWTIGNLRRNTISDYMNARFGHVLLIDGALRNHDIMDIERYLSKEAGFTL